MKLFRFALPALALIALAPAFASAQDASLRMDVVSVTDGEYPAARIVLNIEDRSGQPLPELGPADFRVEAGGTQVAVRGAELASSGEAPLDLLIVVDTSGSMAGDAIANAKSAARALIESLPPTDRVAVVGFGDDVALVQDYTGDRALVFAAIDGLTAAGNTALFQATAVAAIKAGSSAASRRAVILLSDGADFGGRSIATRDEAIAAATGAGVPYFTIAQGTDLDRPFLTQLADATHGRFLEAPQPQDLQDLYLQIGRLLRSQYVVTFDASSVAALKDVPVAITLEADGRTASSLATYRPAPNFAPPISFSGVAEGESIDQPREVLVTLADAPQGTKVTWYVDGAEVAVSDAQPFVYQFDPKEYEAGPHSLRAVASGGATLESGVSFSIAAPPPPAEGGSPTLPLLLAAAAVAGGAVAFFVMKRRAARNRRPAINPDQRVTPWATQVENARRKALAEEGAQAEDAAFAQEDVGEPLGVLISRAGSDLGHEYLVGAKPVAIGSGATCGVRVEDAALAMEEARVWVRDGHMMVHKMARLTMAADDGTGGGWAILEPGDSFPIGQHLFEFRLIGVTAPAEGSEAAAAPNVLRDRDAASPSSAPEGAAPSGDLSPKMRLSELMPKNDGGFISSPE